MPPLVSVILTVYKRTEYLAIALESALAQTMGSFEIIIADDSGLRLAESIYKLYEKDARIIYQPNSHTIGVVNSIKVAISNSNGSFISILNDDDSWEPDFLQSLIQPLRENNNRVIAYSDHWIMDAEGIVDTQATDINTKNYKRHNILTGEIENPKKTVLIDNGIPLAMASVFRKDALTLDALTVDVAGAYDFWISCLLASTGLPFYYVKQRLTNYRVHAQMETGRRSTDKQFNNIYIYKTLLDLNLFPEYSNNLKNKLSFYLYRAGMDNLYFRKKSVSRQYFKKSTKINISYRPLVAYLISYLPLSLLNKLNISEQEHFSTTV